MEAGAQIAASAKQVITQQGSLLRWLQDDLSHRFTRQPLREPAEIHLWTINAERPRCEIDTLFGLLDAAEVARANAFRLSRDRDRFIVFRGALRHVLGHYLGVSPERLSLAFSLHGKPHILTEDLRRRLHFNLAHTAGLGMLAVCRSSAVGIDVEEVRSIHGADRLVARFFSSFEQAVYNSLTPEQKPLSFLRCWTRKEAYLKATGEGLSFPLERVSVTLSPGYPPRLLSVDGRPGEEYRWRLYTVEMPGGSIGALAVAKDDVIIRRYVYCPEKGNAWAEAEQSVEPFWYDAHP